MFMPAAHVGIRRPIVVLAVGQLRGPGEKQQEQEAALVFPRFRRERAVLQPAHNLVTSESAPTSQVSGAGWVSVSSTMGLATEPSEMPYCTRPFMNGPVIRSLTN